jgi:hypothetical protein
MDSFFKLVTALFVISLLVSIVVYGNDHHKEFFYFFVIQYHLLDIKTDLNKLQKAKNERTDL